MDALIQLHDIHKTYHLGEVDVPVLRGISLTIRRGEMVALMGASGSGKTTLMNILGCLDHATSGKYCLDGQDVSRLTPNQRAMVRTEKLGFVFQNFNLLTRTSALQNVIMPLDYALRHHTAQEAEQSARMLLDCVGLADRIQHVPSQMSGGQQQRVAIGRALINRPALLLADEPTGNLDSHTSVEILKMFQQLHAEGITVILVTHDVNVARYADRIVRIADGVIEGEESNLTAHDDGDRSTGTLPDGSSQDRTSPSPADATRRPHRRTVRVRWPATLRTAFMAMLRNKMRSGLSALGVIIAVAAVIAMTEIGQGSKAMLQKSIASMGLTL